MAETDIQDLCAWLDASPTPFHVVDTASRRLEAAGFRLHAGLSDGIDDSGHMVQDGAIIAWRGISTGPLRIIGAHTDSPNLRIQPRPDFRTSGWSQLGIEIYGGVLLNSWLDRDLGVAGRVIDSQGRAHLFNVTAPLARIPQLAIHLDRDVNERGLLLDRSAHLSPVWGTQTPDFGSWLTDITGVDRVVSFDAHLHDITPATLLGVDASLLASARLDNQLSCWAAITALVSSPSTTATIVVLNDHEEVGSASTTGAAGPMLENLVGAVCESRGLGAGARRDLMAESWCLSADNAHALHPNYQDRHDPRHQPLPNHGPALKLNGNQRYATSARGAAHMVSLASAAGVPLQTFVSRNNMPCGSTIGPITATRLGIEAIDIGVPQLSMHSAREVCGAHDPGHLVALMTAFVAA